MLPVYGCRGLSPLTSDGVTIRSISTAQSSVTASTGRKLSPILGRLTAEFHAGSDDNISTSLWRLPVASASNWFSKWSLVAVNNVSATFTCNKIVHALRTRFHNCGPTENSQFNLTLLSQFCTLRSTRNYTQQGHKQRFRITSDASKQRRAIRLFWRKVRNRRHFFKNTIFISVTFSSRLGYTSDVILPHVRGGAEFFPHMRLYSRNELQWLPRTCCERKCLHPARPNFFSVLNSTALHRCDFIVNRLSPTDCSASLIGQFNSHLRRLRAVMQLRRNQNCVTNGRNLLSASYCSSVLLYC